MKQHEVILVNNKDFIIAIARDLINPQKGNDKVVTVLTAYNNVDKTVEAVAECATCQNIYLTPFKIILAYCESKNWFEVTETKKKK